MKELKPGNRVRLYGFTNGSALFKGEVAEVNAMGNYMVNVDCGGKEYCLHRKQCRKLVKKKRKEIWVNDYSTYLTFYNTKEEADKSDISNRIGPAIRFVKAKDQL